jgi:hypothetical protein
LGSLFLLNLHWIRRLVRDAFLRRRIPFGTRSFLFVFDARKYENTLSQDLVSADLKGAIVFHDTAGGKTDQLHSDGHLIDDATISNGYSDSRIQPHAVVAVRSLWSALAQGGRDGRVKNIHAGFAGPASGNFNRQLKEDFTSTIERLLAEGSGELSALRRPAP